MASKGLRAMSYQVTRKVEAGYKPSHTTELFSRPKGVNPYWLYSLLAAGIFI